MILHILKQQNSSYIGSLKNSRKGEKLQNQSKNICNISSYVQPTNVHQPYVLHPFSCATNDVFYALV